MKNKYALLALTSSLCTKLKKNSFPSVQTFKDFSRAYGDRPPHCGETKPEELNGCCHLLMPGSQDKEASAAGALSVKICSVWCGCSLVSLTPMGTAWNNTMSVFFSLQFKLCCKATGDTRSASLLPCTFECRFFHWRKIVEMSSHLNCLHSTVTLTGVGHRSTVPSLAEQMMRF